MFLKRLEMQGFKSFSEKIRLDFKSGITGIVGPNGSGKSNISDAIRWVLGEQNARNLRGDKMEDIIFSGTKNRKALGFAEVSIILDNCDRRIDIDYSEIAITRKVYRSGESSYFINGTMCRLKNINELFMDTGIGKDGYSIIGQGKIDAILSTKTEDRRAIFEEASGITKFKNRRIQAESKLQDVRKNLVRTNDIIAEIENQLEPLSIQKEKAKQFIDISQRLKIVKINTFIYEYKKAEFSTNEILNQLNLLNENMKYVDEKKSSLEVFKNDATIEFESIEISLNESNKEISNTNIKIEKHTNNITLNNQSTNYIECEINKIIEQQKENSGNIVSKRENINLISTSLDAKILEYTIKNSNLTKLENSFNKFIKNLQKEEDDVKNINSKILENMEKASILSNKISLFENEKNINDIKNMEINEQLNFSKSSLNELYARKEALGKLLSDILKDETIIENEIHYVNTQKEQIEKQVESSTSELNILNRNYIELTNKHNILQELEKDYDGYFNSVKAILREKDKTLFGIYGVVVELITVPKQFEICIEIALGSSMQYIISETENDAKLAIEYLRKSKNGRATFLPISAIKGKSINNRDISIFEEIGFLGVASGLIQYEDKLNHIISNLLGRIIIVDNTSNALRISKKYNYSYKIVTLEGDVINTGGSLTGGSIQKKSSGIFSRSREIKNISHSIEDTRHNIEIISNELNEKKEEKISIISELEQKNKDLSDANIEKIKLNNNMQINLENIDKVQNDITSFEETIKNIKLAKQSTLREFEDTKLMLIDVNNTILKLKDGINSYEDNVIENRKDKDEMIDTINSLKLHINDSLNFISNSKNDISRISDEISSLENTNEKFSEEIKLKNQNIIYHKNVVSNTENTLIELRNYIAIKKNDVEMLEDKKADILQKIKNCDNEILYSVTEISRINSEISRFENKVENINNKIDELSNNIWNDYEVTYASACTEFEKLDFEYDKLIEVEAELKKDISNLGNVNVSAIEEFEVLKQRYDFSIKQRDDIIKADEDLQDIIKKLLSSMEVQFKEQFSIIDENFKLVFSEMFGGGTAELKLIDENNVLSSGIDIVAQPYGKSLQNLNLLSGGERTLTAMSLLFAILILKPSPFCVLDEMEAALDDANVTRYANFLKKFCENNQFILITHKTGTMEIADNLYGVTMEEQGISKVISVELKEAKMYTP